MTRLAGRKTRRWTKKKTAQVHRVTNVPCGRNDYGDDDASIMTIIMMTILMMVMQCDVRIVTQMRDGAGAIMGGQ